MQNDHPGQVSANAHESTSGFIPRHHPSLVLVPDWAEFVAWVKDCGGYDESYLDINDSKCLELQRVFVEEQAFAPADADGAEAR